MTRTRTVPPGPPPAGPEHGVLAAAAVAILVLSFAIYTPVFHAGFLQDDNPIIRENPIVRNGTLSQILATDYWAGVAGGDPGLYRPVTILSFALERDERGEVDPLRAHLVNAALHALTGLGLLLLAWRLGAGAFASALAGLLFAAHPIHVSAVALLVGRAEILAALFTLAALFCQSAAGPLAGDAEDGTPPGRVTARAAPWLAGVFTFLALGSKETAIAAPVLLLLLELLFRPGAGEGFGSRFFRLARNLAPSALATVGFLVLRSRAIGSFFGTQHVMLSDNPLSGLHGLERIGTALGLAARAMRLLVVPTGLSPDYSGNVISKEPGLLAPLPIAGILILGSLAALVLLPWLGRRREPPWRRVSLASSLFLLPYLVTGNLLVLVGVVFAERLLYLPSAGFCLLVALGAGAAMRLVARREFRRPVPSWRTSSAAWAVLAVAACGFGIMTWSASHAWEGNEQLWEYAVRATPASPRAQFTLGKIRAEQGRDDEALARFRRATELWPYFSNAWYEQGLILFRKGDLSAAEAAFRKATTQNPNNEGAAVQLGVTLARLGRTGDAIEHLREAAKRFPGSSRAEAELGGALFSTGLYREAAEAYRRAIRLGRGDLTERMHEAESRADHPL